MRKWYIFKHMRVTWWITLLQSCFSQTEMKFCLFVCFPRIWWANNPWTDLSFFPLHLNIVIRIILFKTYNARYHCSISTNLFFKLVHCIIYILKFCSKGLNSCFYVSVCRGILMCKKKVQLQKQSTMTRIKKFLLYI